jgi:integrase
MSVSTELVHVGRRLPDQPVDFSVFHARTTVRDAMALMPYQGAPVDSLERAAVKLEQAAKELREVIEQRALHTAQKQAGYDPHAVLYDALGRKRSPASIKGYLAGRSPATKGKRYPPTPPTVEEITRLMAALPGVCKDERYVERLRSFILIIWRAGLRCSEALGLHETDINRQTGELFVRRGKGDKSRTVGLDDWVWPLLDSWLAVRHDLPAGPLFCVIEGRSAGIAAWCSSGVRGKMAELATTAGIRHRCSPHQFRHAATVEMVLSGENIEVVRRMLGHTSLAVTTNYTRGLPQTEVVDRMRHRRMPVIAAFGS